MTRQHCRVWPAHLPACPPPLTVCLTAQQPRLARSPLLLPLHHRCCHRQAAQRPRLQARLLQCRCRAGACGVWQGPCAQQHEHHAAELRTPLRWPPYPTRPRPCRCYHSCLQHVLPPLGCPVAVLLQAEPAVRLGTAAHQARPCHMAQTYSCSLTVGAGLQAARGLQTLAALSRPAGGAGGAQVSHAITGGVFCHSKKQRPVTVASGCAQQCNCTAQHGLSYIIAAGQRRERLQEHEQATRAH